MSERTCRLVTLGCKVNQYETQLVKETLLSNGFREAAENEAADLCVVNTCTVTGEADSKGRQLIRQLARKNPGTRTIVMGCYATRDPETLRGLPGVFEIVRDKRELPDVFDRLGIVCIIPAVRPGLQSRTPESIEAEVRRLIDNGYQEIVLSGIHVGHYGVDTTRGKSGLPPFRLWHLFEKLDRIPGNWRMRLSSIEAVEVNDEFINAAANCEHLCPQFHPSLQSGSEAVLRRMRRRYSMAKFLEKLEQMRERLDHPAFTTDVIVGFPGETDAEFEETLEACRQARFMKIHVFPFSRRKGTPAAEFPNQVPPEIRKERCRVLTELGRDLAEDYYQTLVGRDLEVLVEREYRDRPGWVGGSDRRYVPVELPGTSHDIGTLVSARGEVAGREQLIANRIENAPLVGVT